MREENVTIAIIGGTSDSEELRTIKQLLEEGVEEGSITIIELQLPELEETCIIGEEERISKLKESFRTFENILIPEYGEITRNPETLKRTANFRNKRHEKSKKVLDNKHYKKPCISTRHYWRGNIK